MKRIISALAALFCLASLLCGCSGGGTESSTAAESTSIPVPEPESSAPESIEPEPESSEPEPAVLVGEIIPAVAETTVSHGSETAFTAQVLPENAADKTLLWESDDESVATVDKGGVVTAVSQGKCRITVRSADGGAVSDIALTVGAPGLTYIQGILVVNKTYSLPADYDPGVDPEAKAALDKMFDDAAKEGIKLWVASGYRSYSHQNSLYNNYVARDGAAAADRYSARPGHSEHQTGLAFDVNRLDISFGESREGKWISANGWKYGFILRYMKETEELTGYMYEPWHIRYLGTDAAKRVYESGLCLEEYLNITSAYAEG